MGFFGRKKEKMKLIDERLKALTEKEQRLQEKEQELTAREQRIAAKEQELEHAKIMYEGSAEPRPLPKAIIWNADTETTGEKCLRRLKAYYQKHKDCLEQQRIDYIEKKIRNLEKGCSGEKKTLYWLRRMPMDAVVIKDFYFMYDDSPVQIDTLVITEKLIFVVETKNWSGNIYLDSSGQFISPEKKAHRNSPFAQSKAQVAFLKQIYKMLFPQDTAQRFQGLVVWANSDSLIERDAAPEQVAQSVVYQNEVSQRIQEICDASKNPPLMVQQTAERLWKYCREHAVPDACPVCGKDLKEISGKYGMFIGCSGYRSGNPPCNYKESISS